MLQTFYKQSSCCHFSIDGKTEYQKKMNHMSKFVNEKKKSFPKFFCLSVGVAHLQVFSLHSNYF